VEVTEITGKVAGIAVGFLHNLVTGPPGPVVTAVSPTTGSPAGGNTVKINGHFFEEVMSVKFGTTNATSYEVISTTEITAVAPPGGSLTHVFVTTKKGAIPVSPAGPGSSYRYVGEEAPEFGRCIKVGAGKGKYKGAACTTAETGGPYEWTPGVATTGFTLSGEAATLETPAKSTIACKASTGTGSFTGVKTVGGVVLELTGCERSGSKCQSPGAAEGELVTSPLTGALGWRNFETGSVALVLSEGEAPVIEAACGATSFTVIGSVITATVPKNNMSLTAALKYTATKGKQTPEHLDGGPTEVLEASFGGVPFEKTGLTTTLTLTSKEEIEINGTI
jgi:hypothetical protein